MGGMKICIDAGHGGTDPGAVGHDPFRLEEKEVVLPLALRLEEELESLGHWVALTRRRDRPVSLDERVDFANRLEAELFVSLHVNAALQSSVEGMEVFHYPGSIRGQQFGEAVLRHMLIAAPGHRDRGVKPAEFLVLRATEMPAILVECEFLSNPEQLQFLAVPENRVILAQAIAAGIHAEALRRPMPASRGTFSSTLRSPSERESSGRR